MRISDWSSDVCSSDLEDGHRAHRHVVADDPATVLDQRRARMVELNRPGGAAQLQDGLVQHQESRGTDRMSAGDQSSGDVHRDLSVPRSEEHTSELQSLMRISYAVLCLKKENHQSLQLSYAVLSLN